MAKLTIVNPVAEAESGTSTAQRFPPAPRPDTLDGKTIGLFWNAKAGGEIALARTRERLASIYPNAKFVDYFGDQGTHMRRASPALLDRIASEVDAAVGTTAD